MTASAQTLTLEGKVHDEQGEPLPFVNVVLLSLPDSAYVQGTVTDEQGVFNLSTSKHGDLLKVSSIGYETQYVTPSQNQTIVLKEETVMLGSGC